MKSLLEALRLDEKKGFTKCKGESDLTFSIVLLAHLDNPGSPFPVFS